MVDPLIQARNIIVTPAIENYILDKFVRLDNFLQHAMKIDVIVAESHAQRDGDQLSFNCTILFPHNRTIRIETHGNNLYGLIDEAYDKMRHNLEKMKEKVNDHEDQQSMSGGSDIDIDVNIDADPVRTLADSTSVYAVDPKITKRVVYEDNTPIHPGEAIERMEILNRSCYLFKNIESGKYAMVFKDGKEGEYALIESPE